MTSGWTHGLARRLQTQRVRAYPQRWLHRIAGAGLSVFAVAWLVEGVAGWTQGQAWLNWTAPLILGLNAALQIYLGSGSGPSPNRVI